MHLKIYSIGELISFYQNEKHFPESILTLSSEALAGKYLEHNNGCSSKASEVILNHIKEVEDRIIERHSMLFNDFKTKLTSTYNILSYITI